MFASIYQYVTLQHLSVFRASFLHFSGATNLIIISTLFFWNTESTPKNWTSKPSLNSFEIRVSLEKIRITRRVHNLTN